MRVLFLALGSNRRTAVIAESRAVVAAGGRPTVLVAQLCRWADEPFAPGVEVVPLTRYRRHWPLAIEHLLLFRGPRFVVRRLAGSGAVSVYNRVIADPVRRWLFRPGYGRVWPDGIHRQFDTFLAEYGWCDAIVVADARSFPAARRVVERLAAAGRAPRVAFRFEQLLVSS